MVEIRGRETELSVVSLFTGGGGLVLGLCVLLAGVLIFRRVRHRVAQLRWWHYLLALGAATILLLLALTSPALTAPGRLPGIVIGIVLLVYGVAVAALSCW